MDNKQTIHYLQRNMAYCSKHEREASERAIKKIKILERLTGTVNQIKNSGGKYIDVDTVLMILEEEGCC